MVQYHTRPVKARVCLPVSGPSASLILSTSSVSMPMPSAATEVPAVLPMKKAKIMLHPAKSPRSCYAVS